jgi:hypothetical protein
MKALKYLQYAFGICGLAFLGVSMSYSTADYGGNWNARRVGRFLICGDSLNIVLFFIVGVVLAGAPVLLLEAYKWLKERFLLP